GKGKASRKTLQEIQARARTTSHADKLTRASRLTAKADTALVQDEYQLYHHMFAFTDKGTWAVVQQGMNARYARRYHWLSDNTPSFIEHDNHIIGDRKEPDVLNLTTTESKDNRRVTLDLAKEHPAKAARQLRQPAQRTLGHYDGSHPEETTYTQRHTINGAERINQETLRKAYEYQPKTYEELLLTKGMGAKTIRGLSLVASLIHGAPATWRDPIKHSFAHGGKDGIPYPVDRKRLDENTRFLKQAIEQARIGREERQHCLKRLARTVT
ncbi:DUF763 domain-containing protein, partial [Candidatus Woesearchaeota archaeon]|nr:DUF763 domain-containing protein [Candidatus Woesearchaeota archaeon]